MASGSKICGECGGLNSSDAESCYRCGARFPGPLSDSLNSLFVSVLGREVPITRLYVGLCLLVYAATAFSGGNFSILGGGMRMSTLLRWGGLLSGLSEVEPWRVLSASFIHFGLLHITFNMMALVDLGRMLERQLGSARYAITLLGACIGGYVLSEYWYASVLGELHVPTGGISGGLFGLVGALLGYMYARKDPRFKTAAVRFGIYAVLLTVALPAMTGGSVVLNNAAHAGGFLVGAPLGLAFYRERRPWRHRTLMRVIAGILVAASFASIALCQVSDLWRVVYAQEQARQRF